MFSMVTSALEVDRENGFHPGSELQCMARKPGFIKPHSRASILALTFWQIRRKFSAKPEEVFSLAKDQSFDRFIGE